MPAKKEKTSEKSPKKTKTNADKSLSVPKRMKPIHDKRQRKEIQRFSEESSEESRGSQEITIRKGKGKKLEDCGNVLAQINKRAGKDELLRMIHGLLLGRVNKKVPVKSNLKSFSGIIYDDEKGREKFEQKLERHKLRDLREIARFFGQEDDGEKEDLVKVITDFVEKPTPSDRSYGSSSEKKATKKSSSSSKKSSSSSKKSSSRKSSGGERRKRKKKDPNEPKRPLSSYMLFCQDHREEAKEKVGKGASITEVAKRMGKMWGKISSDDKKKYERKHVKAKEQYEKEMKKYRKKKEKGSDTSDKE